MPKRHPTLCHLCQYNGHPTPHCFKCPGPTASDRDHSTVTLSLDINGDVEATRIKNPIQPRPAETKMKSFLRMWLRQPRKTQELLAQILTAPPRSGAAIARHTGISRQAVNQRLLKATMESPLLRYALRLRRITKKGGKRG